MTRILLITQFYNEIDNIPELVENIMAQSVRPDTWLLIDDGSTDGSVFQFIEKLREHNAEYEVTRMSWKKLREHNAEYEVTRMSWKFHPDANNLKRSKQLGSYLFVQICSTFLSNGR
jgi:hypothetical protein